MQEEAPEIKHPVRHARRSALRGLASLGGALLLFELTTLGGEFAAAEKTNEAKRRMTGAMEAFIKRIAGGQSLGAIPAEDKNAMIEQGISHFYGINHTAIHPEERLMVSRQKIILVVEPYYRTIAVMRESDLKILGTYSEKGDVSEPVIYRRARLLVMQGRAKEWASNKGGRQDHLRQLSLDPNCCIIYIMENYSCL